MEENLTCAMHHGNSDCVGSGDQETTLVHHFFMEFLIPVSYEGNQRTHSYTCTDRWHHLTSDQKFKAKRSANEMQLRLTLEEHGVDDHGAIGVLNIFGDLGQLAVSWLGCPLVDGIHRTSLVPEVNLGMVVVVVLLAAFHKLVGEGDGARPIQAVVDLPGGVAFLSIAQLEKK